ncbi:MULTISPECIES: hypothetical protein [Streptomyces]|uniref:Transmembrane protein n=1 Tax=Streptomyces stelliscabiei TaxID=146820 RepID=A0A8I0TP33_9ACTN|nr:MULTISPECIES: hypothetical protein [Streptomyces]KND46393.1 hypothetical protein IQ64_01580 [Streptomyces stelliscabiei]MBE1595174.1 hypothetical protein [Streptomyces stelliscabiei]MDX2516136.1 hypothetical protein [Streptomyces stelliscabiei]MDX2553108.1 hypothetical protein [Streptomyces stelliscabiei]MDX2612096.1 hypothetical protein [Streptomyces stelliscabiei]
MTGPYPPTGLRPEDRADFEAVLCRALDTPQIRDALRADPSGLAERRLRVRTSADADAIVAAARGEYRAYLTALVSAADEDANGAGRCEQRSADAGLLPLLAVLTPSLAACSAAVVLVLGCLLRLIGVRGTLPGSLLAAGWTLALFAATSALVALAALLRTALRGPGGPAEPARPEQARLVWQQALLHRGMLPHLRRCLREDPSLSEASPPSRPA